MNKESISVYPNGQKPANQYDDGNIPHEDIPQDIIPDQVPRKDGPGGENSAKQKQAALFQFFVFSRSLLSAALIMLKTAGRCHVKII